MSRRANPQPELLEEVYAFMAARRGTRYSANHLARMLNARMRSVLVCLQALHQSGRVRAEPQPPSGTLYLVEIEAMPEAYGPAFQGELTGWERQLRDRMALCMTVRRL